MQGFIYRHHSGRFYQVVLPRVIDVKSQEHKILYQYIADENMKLAPRSERKFFVRSRNEFFQSQTLSDFGVYRPKFSLISATKNIFKK